MLSRVTLGGSKRRWMSSHAIVRCLCENLRLGDERGSCEIVECSIATAFNSSCPVPGTVKHVDRILVTVKVARATRQVGPV